MHDSMMMVIYTLQGDKQKKNPRDGAEEEELVPLAEGEES